MKHTIYKSREFTRPSQVVNKRRRKKTVRSVLVSLLVLFIAGFLVLMMRMGFLKINDISINGNVSIKTEDIKESVNEMISGNYFYLFPKNNILIFPKVRILAELAKKFPRVDTLQVSIKSNDLAVDLMERKPHALWCGYSFIQSISPCFFVDSQGFVFSPAPQFDGSSYLKLYGAMASSTEATASWQFISEKDYGEVQVFIENVKNLGLELSALEVSDINTYKFQIKNNGLLFVNRNISLAETFENLKAGLSNDAFWVTNKSKTKKFTQVEYIDMRYGNKIFYKLTGQ